MAPTEEELALHGSVGRCEIEGGPEWLKLAECWLTRLSTANDVAEIYDKKALSAVLADRFWQLCWNARMYGPQVWRIFCESSWKSRSRAPLGMRVRLWWQSRQDSTGAVN